jgi:hypothetical protein
VCLAVRHRRLAHLELPLPGLLLLLLLLGLSLPQVLRHLVHAAGRPLRRRLRRLLDLRGRQAQRKGS